MLRELRKKMEEFHMVSPGDRVLTGVSGGADSVCLLMVLLELREEMGFSVEVIHVEHGIRGEESRADARFVEGLCNQYQIICHTIEVDVPGYCEKTGLGLEEAARVLRYEAFVRLGKEQNTRIALAHHMEDNAETILFQMVRGSALAGMCGMQPVREDENGVSYIRPLLYWHRAEIEAFLSERGIGWCVDSTNAQLEYSRNFLRGRVIPDLEQINAQAVAHINQTAGYLSEIRDYMEYETEQVWNKLAKVEGAIALDAKALLELHPVMQRQIAYKAIVLAARHKKDITSAHVADFLSLCRGQSGKRISLPYQVRAWKDFDVVRLASAVEEAWEDVEYEVTTELLDGLLQRKEVKTLDLGFDGARICMRVFQKDEESLEIPRKTYTKWFDYDKIKSGFCIRTRRSGDYFITDGNGHRKKLKSYFIDEKIPLVERGKRWLLAQEHVVLWLIGGRISEHVKVLQETEYIFEITYDGGTENE